MGITDSKQKKIISISIDSGLKESAIADELHLIQKIFPEVDIGSYPYFNQKAGTILVLRSIDEQSIINCEKKVKNLIRKNLKFN